MKKHFLALVITFCLLMVCSSGALAAEVAAEPSQAAVTAAATASMSARIVVPAGTTFAERTSLHDESWTGEPALATSVSTLYALGQGAAAVENSPLASPLAQANSLLHSYASLRKVRYNRSAEDILETLRTDGKTSEEVRSIVHNDASASSDT